MVHIPDRVDRALDAVCGQAEGVELLGHAVVLGQEVERLRLRVGELERALADAHRPKSAYAARFVTDTRQ